VGSKGAGVGLAGGVVAVGLGAGSSVAGPWPAAGGSVSVAKGCGTAVGVEGGSVGPAVCCIGAGMAVGWVLIQPATTSRNSVVQKRCSNCLMGMKYAACDLVGQAGQLSTCVRLCAIIGMPVAIVRQAVTQLGL